MIKNRPQTSYRIATKNTFQLGSTQVVPSHLQQKDLASNKENVGILNNSMNHPNIQSASTQNATVLQKQVESIPTIQNIFSETQRKKESEQTTEIERECNHVNDNYGVEIDEYQRELEL